VLAGPAHMPAELLSALNWVLVPDLMAHGRSRFSDFAAALLHLTFGRVGVSLSHSTDARKSQTDCDRADSQESDCSSSHRSLTSVKNVPSERRNPRACAN
jgi:hypothetical protein